MESRRVFLEFAVEERVVLHLAYAVGHSRQDIADIMNISRESVDALLGAARRGYSRGHVQIVLVIDVLHSPRSDI
jgi:DNA-binding CsgD family transcriptional regulator